MLKIGYLWIVIQVHIHEFRIYVDRSIFFFFFFVHSGSSKDFSCYYYFHYQESRCNISYKCHFIFFSSYKKIYIVFLTFLCI